MKIITAREERLFTGRPHQPSFGIAELAEFGSVQRRAMRGELRQNEPMARHTSWRAGGCADRAFLPANLDDLAAFLRPLPPREPVLMVGLGSNLLVRDGGLRGTVILVHWALREMRHAARPDGGGEIDAQAGIPSPRVARFAALHGLVGAEFLVGIPGTVGGALAMNAGCYGGETWEIVSGVTTIDRSGALRERTKDDYDIAYRHVRLKAKGERRKAKGETPKKEESGPLPPSDFLLSPSEEVRGQLPPSDFLVSPSEWFVSARFRLAAGDGDASRRRMKDLLTQRIATQPLNQPNAGSVFRNPPGDYAARLIEACGLKGHASGGAQISEKHANFIVNRGGARASDIEALIELAERSVREKFGVVLEREVRIVGER